MNFLVRMLGRAVVGAALVLPLLSVADPVTHDVFFDGGGSIAYDTSTGVGAWLGTLNESPFPVVPAPLSFLSYVSFVFDGMSGLTGTFEFTTTDLMSTLTGDLTGQLLAGEFASGGQLSVDYSITGGTGDFLGANGFGISFVSFGPQVGGFNDYTEAGVMSFAVPEPPMLALLTTGLLAGALFRRRSQPVNWRA